MGVPHSRNRRSAPAETEGVVRGRSRVAKREAVGDGRPKRGAKRASTSLALASPKDAGRDGGPAIIDAELVDTSSSGGTVPVPAPAGQVIEVKIVGYWDDVRTIVGGGLAKWASREISRELRRLFR